VNIDDAVSPEELPCTVHTFVRPIEAFPKNFEAEARKRSGSHIVPMPSERALLNGFLGMNTNMLASCR
jgi:DNA polymerase alpha subunit A